MRIDRYLHTGSLPAFKAAFLSYFALAFFGIGLYRLWYQFNFYNLHFSADVGLVTVGANIVRVAVIAILVFLMARTRFRHISRSVFVWSGFVLMSASSVLYLLEIFFGGIQFEMLRIIIGGVGLVGGEIIWIFFLERLRPGEVFFCLAGGLALSCALSLVMGYLDDVVAGMVNLFIPALSVFAYWQSMEEIDRRQSPSFLKSGSGLLFGAGVNETPDSLYERKPLRTGMIQAVVAFFLYAFLLGMGLGYPDGSLRELSQMMRSIHQVLVIGLIAVVVGFVLVRGRAFDFQRYWLFQNVFMMASICLLMSHLAGAEELSTFLLTTAVTCFYFPMIFFICMIARHTRLTAAGVYAVVYGGSLLCMSAGRLIVHAVGPFVGENLWLLIAMALILVVESTLVLRAYFMDGHPPGFELARLAISTPLTQQVQQADQQKQHVSQPETRMTDRLTVFSERYGLTEVEQAIVSLIAQGRSRRVIADELKYSPNTIRNYTRIVYRKVGVHTKQELLDRL